MRHFGIIMSLALVACSSTSGEVAPGRAPPAAAEPPRMSAAVASVAPTGPFTGVWQDCDEGSSPDACSRYRLMQRGERICGTWSYVATGDVYEGRLTARAQSATEARRTHVCGRPGSEARTGCEDGWDRTDKPLRLCDGKLADGAVNGDACRARFERVEDAQAELAQWAAEPWVQACLSGVEPKAAR